MKWRTHSACRYLAVPTYPVRSFTHPSPNLAVHELDSLLPYSLIQSLGPSPPHPYSSPSFSSSSSSFFPFFLPLPPLPSPLFFRLPYGCPTLSCRKRLLQDFVSLSSLLTNNYAIVLGSFKYYFNFQNFIEDAVFEPMAIPGVHSSFHYFIILCQKLDRCLFVSTLLRQLLIKTEE